LGSYRNPRPKSSEERKIMTNIEITNNSSKSGRLIVSALGLARYAPRGMTLVAGLFMIEIGKTFGTPVGITSQLNTTFSFIALLTALSMGVLTIRFRLKTLLLAGLTLAVISAIGCFLSPSFSILFLLYSINGISWSMIYPMSTALVGELIPLEKRAGAFSWIFAIPPIITVFGSVYLGYIGSWRMALILFAIPIALITIILTIMGLPNIETNRTSTDLLDGFKAIISNSSAISCLLAMLMHSVAWQMMVLMSLPYLREYFEVSREVTSLIYSGFALAVFIGARLGGRVVNKFGRKPVSVVFASTFGVCTVLFILVPSALLAASLGILACLVTGTRQTAMNSLIVEQLPQVRGAMMSITTASLNLGATIGTGIGGYLLLIYGWKVMGVSMGMFGILGGIILYIFAIDPTVK
jgi:predicted MFS family arabinose efflux permease